MNKIFLAVICVCFLSSFPGPQNTGANEDSPRNVLLITIDTLRADHLSCNGSTKVQTPNLDSLAAGGANFTRTRSSVPLTLPSHASILTALYPLKHGVRDNAAYRLNSSTVTLAEILKKHGYVTAAFVGSFVLDHRFGLDQGFDVYNDRMPADSAALENLEAERNADAVYSAFIDWLKTYDGTKPFFVWIHLYDPHTPYSPPEPYLSKYTGNRYAGEIAYTDSIVGKITKSLETRKAMNNSLIAVVGDHGEGLGQHKERTHSVLIYNSTLDVPMILFAPGLVQPGVTVRVLTRTIDLAPTILDYLGYSEKLGEGISVRTAVEKTGPTQEIFAYSESLYPRLNLGWSELHGLESEKHHFILAPQPELYDVQKDPLEINNQIKMLPDVAQQLQQKLKGITGDTAGASPQRELDAEEREKLESLGYVSGLPAPRVTAIDPKNKMEVWDAIQIGLTEFNEGHYRAAVKSLDGIRAANQEILLVYDYLGESYMRLKEWTEAKRIFTLALQQGHDTSGVHANLGISYYELNEIDRAQEELEKAIAVNGQNVVARYHLGNVLRKRGDLQQAAEQYQRALEINPRYVYAVNGLGMAYSAMKKDVESLRYFREAVRLDPKNPSAYFNLAAQLDHMGQSKEALEAYRKSMSLATGNEFAELRQEAADAIKRLERK